MNVFKSLILALVLLGAEGRSCVALAERFLLMCLPRVLGAKFENYLNSFFG